MVLIWTKALPWIKRPFGTVILPLVGHYIKMELEAHNHIRTFTKWSKEGLIDALLWCPSLPRSAMRIFNSITITVHFCGASSPNCFSRATKSFFAGFLSIGMTNTAKHFILYVHGMRLKCAARAKSKTPNIINIFSCLKSFGRSAFYCLSFFFSSLLELFPVFSVIWFIGPQ